MKNPLFYNKVVPVDKTVHREYRLDTGAGRFGFAREANLVPAVIDEFGAAAPHLTIAFLPGGKSPAAVFVVGLQPASNLFLSGDDRWNGGYVPAYLRRYPFIVGDVPNGNSLLCIDEAHPGATSGGERIFSDSGEPEPVLVQARDLAADYKRSADRTDEFCATLQRLGLFTGVSLNAKAAGGGNTAVHGLFIVDEKAFDALSPGDAAELHEKGFLKPIVQHLVSLASIGHLGDRNSAKVEQSTMAG